MVERVRDHRVFWSQKRLKQSPIGVKAGCEEDRIIHAQEVRQTCFKIAVQILGAADKPDGGHAKPVIGHRAFGGFDKGRMIGQAQIVVGAKVDHLTVVDSDRATVGRGDEPFLFHQALCVDLGKGIADVGQETGHERILYS